MKWYALFWVYRREALSGWRRGWRKDARFRQAAIELFRSGVALPGWIERPMEAPEITPEGQKRLRASLATAAGRPLLTINEARATLNLPPLESGTRYVPRKRRSFFRRLFNF